MKKFKILLIRIYPSIFDSIQYPFNIDPPYSLKYTESLLQTKLNIKPSLLDCYLSKMLPVDIITKIKDEKYNLVIIHSSFFNYKETNNFVRSLKESIKDVFIIGTGSGHSKNIELQHLNNMYDIILLGEPEFEIINILKDINNSNNLVDKIDKYQYYFHKKKYFINKNLDKLPFPVYSKKELKSYKLPYPVTINKPVTWGIVIASKGCNQKCFFCSEAIRTSFSRKLRLRSPELIIKEIKTLTQSDVNVISFEDDNFTANHLFIKEFTEKLRQQNLNIKWIARARVDEITEDIIIQLKRSGCIHLNFGIESATQRIIDVLGKQKTRTKTSWTEICLNAVKLCKKHKISTTGFYIIGSPTETYKEVMDTLNFAKKLNTDIIQIHFFTPYPDSHIKDRSNNTIELSHHYNASSSSQSELSKKELEELRSKFYFQYIFRFYFIINHLKKYFIFYILNPLHTINMAKIFISILKTKFSSQK